MDLNTITVSNFKAQFARDFAYLPTWSNATTYNAGAIVFYATNSLFYKCLLNGTTAVPTDATKWELHAAEQYDYILDADITKAFTEAQANFNQGLFGDDTQITLAYLYLTAHYLVFDLQTSAAGINSTGQFNVSARSVGSVSESYSIPKIYEDNPTLSFYAKTGYGSKYISLLLPNLIGNMTAVWGGTNA